MDAVVLRLPRIDHQDGETQFVLLHVSSEGRRPLDLKLIGTENTTVFSVSLKHDHTSSLKAKNSSINQEEWKNILAAILRRSPPEEEHAAAAEGVEAVAKIENDSSFTITIQKRIEGITQRLGTITLPANEDEEVDLFEWCGLSIKEKEALNSEARALKASLNQKEDEVSKLSNSLAELVDLKNENETQLLEKFSLLLNEKKLKIRDQQRLLAAANVDASKLKAVEESRGLRSHSAGPSRTGKRKAAEQAQANSDDESDGGGFEKMEVDKVGNDSEQDQAQTPDESTADEAESEEEAPAPPPLRKAVDNPTEDGKAKSSTSTAVSELDLPPKRELPFVKKRVPVTKPVASAEGSATESEDDEL